MILTLQQQGTGWIPVSSDGKQCSWPPFIAGSSMSLTVRFKNESGTSVQAPENSWVLGFAERGRKTDDPLFRITAQRGDGGDVTFSGTCMTGRIKGVLTGRDRFAIRAELAGITGSSAAPGTVIQWDTFLLNRITKEGMANPPQLSDGYLTDAQIRALVTETSQAQSDWDETDSTKADYIKNKPTIPTALSDLTSDAAHRTVTDTEKTSWNGKMSEPSGKTANKYLGTDADNILTWKTVEEPDYPVTSVNSKTGAVVLDADDVEAISRDGWEIATLAGTAVPAAGKVYEHTLAADEVFTFFTPETGKDGAFELDLTQPATAVSFTLPTVTWKFGTPDFSTGGKTYYLRFRYIGGAWQGWTTPEMSEYVRTGSDASLNQVATTHGFICNSNQYSLQAKADKSLILGYNTINGSVGASIVCGSTTFTGVTNYCLFLGQGVKCTVCNWGSVVLGVYNVDLGVNAAFVFGGGTAANRKNIEVLDWNGNLTLAGAVITAGKSQSALAASSGAVSVPATEGQIYTYTLAGNETITMAAPTSGYSPSVELWLTQPATAVSFSWGSTIWWDDGTGYYDPDNAAPSFTTGDRVYALQFLWDGTRWLGKVASKRKVVTA